MDFGLGLVLSFTDRASSGMQNAANHLSDLTRMAEQASGSLNRLGDTTSLYALQDSCDRLGGSFIRVGRGLTSLFTDTLTKVQRVGQEFENFDTTLTSLYGGMSTGAKKSQKALDKLFEFSTRSPLEVGEVKDMLVTLQSQGINAFDKTTGAITNTRKEYLSWLTDLKSFKPEVPTVRFKMAIQNYVGSGEKRMMRTVFDMGDIEDIIGHKMGNNAEERMQDIVEMVEKKGLTGLSENMSKTWTGVASNINDGFTRIFYSISKNGVFNKLKGAFMSFAKIITKMDGKELDALGKTVADALNTMVTPLNKAVKGVAKLFKGLIKLTKTNPKLAKFAMILTTVSGGLLIGAGVMMKLVGSFASFSIVLREMGSLSSVFNMISHGLWGVTKTVAPLALVLGGFYLAWKNDFGGIRTEVTSFVNHVTTCFKDARNAVDGNISAMVFRLSTLEHANSFWGNIEIGMMKLYGTIKFVAEAWNTYTLSNDSYEKANKLGILPLITSILMLKKRFHAFKTGFIEGWSEISAKVHEFLGGIFSKLESTPFKYITDRIKSVVDLFNKGSLDDWREAGKVFAKFSYTLLKVLAVVKLFTKVSKLFKGGGIIGNLLGGDDRGGGGERGNMKPASTLKTFGNMALILIGTQGLLAVMGMISNIPFVKELTSGGIDAIGKMFDSLIPLVGTMVGASIAFKVLERLKLNPDMIVDGIKNTAVTLGGLEVLFVAMGAIISLPYFNEFLSKGGTVITKIADTLSSFKILVVGGALGAMTLLGKVKEKVALRGIENTAILLGGLEILITAMGAVIKIPGFNDFLNKGSKVVTKIADTLSSFKILAVGGSLVAMTLLGKVKVKVALRGIENTAILLGGLEALIIAMGAIISIPYFTDFLNKGGNVITNISNTLAQFSTLSNLGALGAMCLLGVVPVTIAAKGLANTAILLGGLEVLITAMGALASIPYFMEFLSTGAVVMTKIGQALASIASLSSLGSIAAMCLLGAVPIPLAVAGLENTAILLGGLEVLLTAMGALASIPGFQEFLDTGGEVLIKIFNTLGNAFGSAIGGFGEGITDSLPAIGSNLASFMENVSPMFDLIKEAPIDAFGTFASGLGELILALTADGIVSFITGGTDLATLGVQLCSFVNSAKPFFVAMEDISEDSITKAAKVFGAMEGLGNSALKTGGLKQWFTGETSLDVIGTQLASFAPNGKTFFDAVKEYPQEGIDKAQSVFDSLGGIGDYDFKTGGLAQLFTGTTSLSNIGEQLVAFAPNGTEFFNAVKDYPQAGIDKAKDVFASLCGIGEMDLESGGLVQLWSGSTNLGDVGEQLSDFAEEAESFFNYIGGVPASTMDNANVVFNAFSLLSDLKEGGLKSIIEGTIDLPSLGEQLSEFSENAAGFFGTMAELDYTGIVRGKSALEALTILGDSAFKSGGLMSYLSGSVNVTKLGENLTGFAKGTKAFFKKAGEMKEEDFDMAVKLFNTVEKISGVTDIANSSNGNLQSFGEELVSFSKDFNTFISNVKDGKGGKASFSNITTGLKSFQDSMTATSTNFANNTKSMEDSIVSLQEQVSKSLKNIKEQFSNLKLKLPEIKVPHFKVEGNFEVGKKKSSVPKVSVDWYKNGGVFNSPNIIGVGEDGEEAVMPLERNTGWIDKLSHMIVDGMGTSETTTNINNTSSKPYVDNSIHFERGSIVIEARDTSPEEAERFAELIMQKIQRKQELQRMMNYA